jgi:hypothetical protein
VPEAFAEFDAEERARAALDVVHTTVEALAQLRGWDLKRLDAVRGRVEDRGLRFDWASEWKASPGRRHQARAVYWLDDEGQGGVQLEIRRHADQTVIARGGPALAFMTVEGFKRSAKTLRWHGADTVTVTPWAGLFGDQADFTQLSVSAPLAPDARPSAIAPRESTISVVTTVLTGEEWQDDPDLPWMSLEFQDSKGSGAYGLAFDRTSRLLGSDASFRAWWAQTPFRRLRLWITVPDPQWSEQERPKAGARKHGIDLVLKVVTEFSSLPPKGDVDALRERARLDLHDALAGLATARKLPAPPPLPAVSP